MSRFVSSPFQCPTKQIHEECWVFGRSLLSLHNYVSFTDNVSVPQTLDYSVNPGFAKLVSATDNSSIPTIGMIYIDVHFAATNLSLNSANSWQVCNIQFKCVMCFLQCSMCSMKCTGVDLGAGSGSGALYCVQCAVSCL